MHYEACASRFSYSPHTHTVRAALQFDLLCVEAPVQVHAGVRVPVQGVQSVKVCVCVCVWGGGGVCVYVCGVCVFACVFVYMYAI